MPWPLCFRDDPKPWENARPGDCWYYPEWTEQAHPYPLVRNYFMEHQASVQYIEQNARERPPIIVYLPLAPGVGEHSGFPFSPDEKYRGGQWGANLDRMGWTVTGRLEDSTLTVQPSVNVIGTYHGWIGNGMVSDDVEGRTAGTGPKMFTHAFSDICTIRVWPALQHIQTIFHDGTIAAARPQDDNAYAVTTESLGYGDDRWRQCLEHEIMHTWVPMKMGEPRSRILWNVAHGGGKRWPPGGQEEEAYVMGFQRFLNTGEENQQAYAFFQRCGNRHAQSADTVVAEARQLIKSLGG